MARLVLALIIILMLVGFLVAKVNDLDLSEEKDRVKFVKQYGKWVYKSVINIKAVVGFVVKQDWNLNEEKNETD
ncbi:MAG: hypothetical protein ABIB47_00875 [Candidatus Woesearchaeota archaeon]